MDTERKSYVEQVLMTRQLADAVYDEASRRGVSRAQVIREAVGHHLGLRGEGSAEPDRRDKASRNYGAK